MILLTAINAKYIHSNPAIYSLRAYALAHCDYGNHIQLAEYTINNQIDYILEGIYRAHPDVLCFSCYIWNIEYVCQVAEEFHKLCPDTHIWVGGPEVSFCAADFLNRNQWCYGIMVGEGEETFCELLCHYADGSKSLDEINSIVYRHEGLLGNVICTSMRPPIEMDKIPFVYGDMGDFENRIVYYESSRGCPFSCSYCLSSIDKKLRFRNLELVKKELQHFLDMKVPQVKFVDRTFNCNHDHARGIWEYILAHDNGVTNFHFEISADLLTDEEIELIGRMRPGLIQLEIGVQSTCPATIKEIHRTMNLEKLRIAVARIQSFANTHMHLDLIAGLPYEDLDRFASSFDEVYAMKPDQLQLGFLKVLRGSYMYDHAQEYGIMYHANAPYEVLQTHWISYEDILKLKRIEDMVEVYYNSGQFSTAVKLLEVLHERPFELYSGLGDYYDRHGYFAMSHNRLRRAEILLEYVQESFENLEDYQYVADIIRQALTYDLYGRENCKTRPFWAPDPGTFKDMTHRFCPKGKITHIEPFNYVFPDAIQRTIKKLPDREDRQVWYLFDYSNRNPLDNQAHIERAYCD